MRRPRSSLGWLVGSLTVQDDAFFDAYRPEATNGPRVAWFVENYCTFTDGELFGKPFRLEAWQRWVLDLMFEVDPATGLRRWREFVLVIPRGNGKSALVSALGFYFLIYDGEGAPEVYSSAWGEDQARAVFDPARLMHDASPMLQRVSQKFAKAITCPESAGSWKLVSRIAETKQGKKPHALLNDELHVHKSHVLRDTFIRGMHKRRQPIALDVTTEGIERSGPLEDLQQGFFHGVAQGVGTVETIHECLQVFRLGRQIMVRWGVPRGERVAFDDRRIVRLCNPLSVIDVDELIATQAPPAAGKTEAEFRTYHMNDAVEQSEEGVPMEAWDACGEDCEPIPPGSPVTVFIDAGFRRDCSAVVVGWRRPDGRVQLDSKVWTPARDRGLDVDLSSVLAYVDEVCSTMRVERLIADPYMLAAEIQSWTSRLGARRVREYRFSWNDTAPDSVTFLAAIQEQRVAHNRDGVFRQHVANLRTKYGPNGAWRFDNHPMKKDRPEDYPNDAGIAAMVVVGDMMAGEQPSKYKGRGLLVIPPA